MAYGSTLWRQIVENPSHPEDFLSSNDRRPFLMILDLDVHLHYRMQQVTDLLLHIEAANLPDQIVQRASLALTPTDHFTRVSAEDGIGERIWMQASGDFICDYRATVEITRRPLSIAHLAAVPPYGLPGPVIRYLMPSRYCPADAFHNFVAAEFGALTGGARILAMRDWIKARILYVPGSSTSHTTALDTFVQMQGICRDFAHLMICFARASGIPARFASAYALGVTPQDFHAVAEVYLEYAWHPVDPTEMAEAEAMACIGVGMDAADVAFLTSFGPVDLVAQSVTVVPLEP